MLRAKFWNYPQLEMDYAYHNFITERIPMGSTITPYGYLLPNNRSVVTRDMQEAIKKLNRQYRIAIAAQGRYACNETLEEKLYAQEALRTKQQILGWLEQRRANNRSGNGSTL